MWRLFQHGSYERSVEPAARTNRRRVAPAPNTEPGRRTSLCRTFLDHAPPWWHLVAIRCGAFPTPRGLTGSGRRRHRTIPSGAVVVERSRDVPSPYPAASAEANADADAEEIVIVTDRPPLISGLGRDGAAVDRGDRRDDRQTEPEAVMGRAVADPLERLEDPIGIRRADHRAGVGHGQPAAAGRAAGG